VDNAAIAEKRLIEFDAELIEDLANLREVYKRHIECIGDLCSPVSEGDPSVGDYLRWFAMEDASLPEVFSGVIDNLIIAVIEGVLVMAGDSSVDLTVLQVSTAASGADILPGGREIQKIARAITRSWWRSFGYGATLAAIQAKLRDVDCCVRLFCL
jgi:hypothetical protein